MVVLVWAVVVVVVTSSLLSRFRKYLQGMSVALVLLFSVQVFALADSSIDWSTHYYDLSAGLMVIKPSIAYENKMSLDTTINGRFTLDRVRSGGDEFDSISSASQVAGNSVAHTDIRQEYSAGVSHTIKDWKLDVGYVMSLEDDYRSNAPSLSLSKDFNQRNTTLSLGYAHNFDWVNGIYMDEAKDKNVENASVSLSQILTPTSLMQISYTLQYNTGYLATGNRQVLLENELMYDEYLPGTRLRQAIGLRAAKWLANGTVVHGAYRYYRDDWGLDSNTGELRFYQSLGSGFRLRAEYRYYRQDSVDFMRESYTGSEQYLSSASSLRAFSSHLVGLKLTYQPKNLDNIQIHMKYERYSQINGLEGNVLMLSTESLY